MSASNWLVAGLATRPRESYSRRARQVCLALLLCGLTRAAFGQAGPAEKLSVNDRTYFASKVFELLHVYFNVADATSRLSSDASYRNYLQGVLINDDRHDFDLLTMQFMGELHNGHTFFSDSWLEKAYGQPLGFYAAPCDGKWAVQYSVLNGLKSGDVIVNIEAVGIDDFSRKQQKYISASSAAAQRHNLFLFPYLFPLRFTLTLDDGRKVVVDRTSGKQSEQRVEGHWLKHGETAYMRIPSFYYPFLEDQALEHASAFQKAKSLIIDLRNNPGGIPPTRLIRALMDRPYRGWKESTIMRVPLFDSYKDTVQIPESNGAVDHMPGYLGVLGNQLGNSQLTRDAEYVSPSPIAFHGRLILLVDGGCISACEDFVEPFKDNSRATIVGETTQGSSGTPYFYDFGNGMSVKIAVKREYFPDGSEFEGVGIKPDIEARPSIEDLRNRRDVVLEKALEFIRDR